MWNAGAINLEMNSRGSEVHGCKAVLVQRMSLLISGATVQRRVEVIRVHFVAQRSITPCLNWINEAVALSGRRGDGLG